MLVAGLAWLATLGMAIVFLWVAFATDFLEFAAAEGALAPTTEERVVLLGVIVAFAAVVVAYASVGALLAGRRGAGRIAALLLAGGLLFASVPFGFFVGGLLIIDDPSSAAFNAIFLLGPLMIGPGYVSILPGLALAFPDGRLPGRRWRWPVGIALGAVSLGTVIQLIRPGPLVGSSSVATRNPFGIDLLPPAIAGLAGPLVVVGIVAMTTLGTAAVVARYRRGSAIERQQQRWFLAAVSLAALPLAMSAVPGTGGPETGLVAALGLLLVPIAVGIAVTRYRLYEIDRLINRTLVYVPLTALLAGLYAAIVALLQRVFQSVTGDSSDAAIVITTLILASVFTPVRKWLEGIVERRYKPAPGEGAALVVDPTIGSQDWDDRVAAVALRVVRAELKVRPQRVVAVGGGGGHGGDS